MKINILDICKKKNLTFIINILFCLSFFNHVSSANIDLEAIEILTSDQGNTIIANKEAKAEIKNELKIFANKFIYKKNKDLLIAEGNVEVFDLINNIKIFSNLIYFDEKKKLFTSFNDTQILVDEEYNIVSKNINYSLNLKKIFSEDHTEILDKIGNRIIMSKIEFSEPEKIVKGNDITLYDTENNTYFVEKGMIKLIEKQLTGKDVEIKLKKDSFGNIKNDPRLKGNSINYSDNQTIVTKGVFTSCANIENCSPWKITSEKITHDKKKKQINYKNAWLKIYDLPILYFPKFFHPDPAVDRKSGFLTPSFSGSNNLGSSVTLPYFHVISDNSDLTFKPRFFSNTEYLLQSEYRLKSKNSSHILDFSINKKDEDNKNGTQNHFFLNSNYEIEKNFFRESFLNLKLERVSNDNFIRDYSIESTSPIIKDTSVLENSLGFYGYTDNNFETELSLESYETLGELSSDRYEFIYPNYLISKSIYLDNEIINDLEFNSSGNQKKYSTNINEISQINNFLISSNEFVNTFGLQNNFKLLLKNVNSQGKNSTKLKDKEQSEIFSLLQYDLSVPLFKKKSKYTNSLTPKASFKTSPNETKSLKNENRILDINNIYALDRLGFNETVETGSSLTLGFDFDSKSSNDEYSFFSSKVATVLRDKENKNLPISSTLNKKRSDVIGMLELIPNKNVNFRYNYSINNDLDEINLHNLKNVLTINNFINEFSFYEENNLIGNNSYFENKSTLYFDDSNSLNFQTRKNKKTNLTEFYKLIYEYKNDCLTASIVYNKDYYSSSSQKPNESLFFNITLIPLGSTKTGNAIQ